MIFKWNFDKIVSKRFNQPLNYIDEKTQKISFQNSWLFLGRWIFFRWWIWIDEDGNNGKPITGLFVSLSLSDAPSLPDTISSLLDDIKKVKKSLIYTTINQSSNNLIA